MQQLPGNSGIELEPEVRGWLELVRMTPRPHFA
jgi:hypothetical protein